MRTRIFSRIILVFILVASLLYSDKVYSEEIRLTNGDTVTGVIVEENQTEISVKTEAMGVVLIRKEFVKDIIGITKKEATKEEKEVRKDKKTSLRVSDPDEADHVSQEVF